MTDLETATTQELVDELKRRNPAGGVTLYSDMDAKRERRFIHSWGGIAALGMVTLMYDECKSYFVQDRLDAAGNGEEDDS